MYLLLSDADSNVTPEVFHDGVDVIGLRASEKEKSRRKRFDKEGPTEKIGLRRSVGKDPTEKIRWRISVREDPTEKIRLRRSNGEGPLEKRAHSRINHGSDTMLKDRRKERFLY